MVTYTYDADNRLAYTTTITSTEVITYNYDMANHLLESTKLGGDTTTYEWDNAGRLITTTVGLNVSRVYTYRQSGDLTAALGEGLLTTFVYDGDGRRLQMSVAGELVTYTLDYAGGGRVLLEEGGAFSGTKHYLYGLECIAELVDADEPDSEEWRYYHQDGNQLVRQTTNMQATITFAWTYSPEGAVLLGEEGPVTNLGCGAIYDWSTGLIFKQSRYFDPNSGIWLTMSGLVMYQGGWPPYNRQYKGGGNKKQLYSLLLLLLLLSLVLTGCMPGDPTAVVDPTQVVEAVTETAVTKTCVPTATATPSPTATDNPTMPPPLNPTAHPTVTLPPLPTEIPTPSPTPSPWLPFPIPNFKLGNPFGNSDFWILNCDFGDNNQKCVKGRLGGSQDEAIGLTESHQGVDLITDSDKQAYDNGTILSVPENDPSRQLYMPVRGYFVRDQTQTEETNIYIRGISHDGKEYEIGLTHIKAYAVPSGTIEKGTPLNIYYGDYGNTNGAPHLHLTVRTVSSRDSRVFYDPLSLLLPSEHYRGIYGDN